MQQLGSKGGRVRKGECAECIIGKLGLGSVQLLEPRKNIERPFGPRPISIPVAALRRLFPALSEVSCKTRLHIDHEWFRSVSRAVARIGGTEEERCETHRGHFFACPSSSLYSGVPTVRGRSFAFAAQRPGHSCDPYCSKRVDMVRG